MAHYLWNDQPRLFGIPCNCHQASQPVACKTLRFGVCHDGLFFNSFKGMKAKQASHGKQIVGPLWNQDFFVAKTCNSISETSFTLSNCQLLSKWNLESMRQPGLYTDHPQGWHSLLEVIPFCRSDVNSLIHWSGLVEIEMEPFFHRFAKNRKGWKGCNNP